MSGKLVIGTRKSHLALTQTEFVRSELLKVHPSLEVEIIHIVTQGDLSQSKDETLPSIGGKGVFTAELEQALAEKRIDIAVHSLKDLPTTLDNRFCIGAIPKRESPADVFISRDGKSFQDLKQGAVIGTSSLRREAQLRQMRSDLKVQSVRGNIDTRIKKLRTPGTSYDAIVLAEAGLNRIGRSGDITETFAFTDMVPAAAQGALGIQCRTGDKRILDLLAPLHDAKTGAETDAEREFLATLQAGCNTPLGCIAQVIDQKIHCFARALSKDGSRSLEVSNQGDIKDAKSLGRLLGEEMIERGVKNLEL
jgi:hydroxymethylbilane synthase